MIRIRKRIVKVFLFIPFVFSQFTFMSCSTNTDYHNDDVDVVIELDCDEHSHVKSKNPQIVKKGKKANFELTFDTDYKFYSATTGDYNEDTSILTIDSVDGNLTSKVTSISTKGYTLKILNDSSFGNVSVYPDKQFYSPNETVRIEIKDTSRDFLCFTKNLPYRVGRNAICGVPLSYDNYIDYKIDGDTLIYTNYFETNGKIIDYELNGGFTKAGYTLIHTDCITYDDKPYFFQNTINLSCYAYRDGYLLESLNTKIDGSGTRIGIGSRINNKFFNNNKVILYAQWKKCTKNECFEIADSNDHKATITSIKNVGANELVIPTFINGKKIIGIEKDALFNGNGIEKLYLPDSIEFVKSGAFKNMNSLTDLYLFMSIEEISKESFDAPILKTLHFNKNTYTTNGDTAWYNMSVYKEAIMNLDSNKSKVIAVGHSTIRQNHDLAPLNDAYGEKYSFFIYGAAAGIDEYLLLSSLSDCISPEDYLLIPVWPLIEKNKSGPRNFSYLQYDLDSISFADYSLIKDYIWESYLEYLELCTKEIGVNAYMIESHNHRYFNSTGGDYAGEETDDPNNGKGINYTDYLKNKSPEPYRYLHDCFDFMGISEDHVLLTWNPYNENCIYETSGYIEYDNMIRSEFQNCLFFDSQLDNIYPGNYFLVNDYSHVSRLGGIKRIEKWVLQLKDYFS